MVSCMSEKVSPGFAILKTWSWERSFVTSKMQDLIIELLLPSLEQNYWGKWTHCCSWGPVVSCGAFSLQSVQPWKSVSLDCPPVLSAEGLSQHRELVLALLMLCCGILVGQGNRWAVPQCSCNSKSHCQAAPGHWGYTGQGLLPPHCRRVFQVGWNPWNPGLRRETLTHWVYWPHLKSPALLEDLLFILVNF